MPRTLEGGRLLVAPSVHRAARHGAVVFVQNLSGGSPLLDVSLVGPFTHESVSTARSVLFIIESTDRSKHHKIPCE